MGILIALISTVVIVVVLGISIPILWPMMETASANITAMTGTDAGTSAIQGFWPIVMLVVGISVAVGLVIFALKKFNIMGM